MNPAKVAMAACILGAITYMYRFSFINRKGRQIAERIPQSFLNLLAPATFAAIVASNLATHKGTAYELQLKIAVLVLSIFVAAFTRSIMATLAFGLILLYALKTYVT